MRHIFLLLVHPSQVSSFLPELMAAGWGKGLCERTMAHLAASHFSKVIIPRTSGAAPRCCCPAAHIRKLLPWHQGTNRFLTVPCKSLPAELGPGPATLAIFSHVLYNAAVDDHLHISISQLFPGAP